jgi:hypothetical protein
LAVATRVQVRDLSADGRGHESAARALGTRPEVERLEAG